MLPLCTSVCQAPQNLLLAAALEPLLHPGPLARASAHPNKGLTMHSTAQHVMLRYGAKSAASNVLHSKLPFSYTLQTLVIILCTAEAHSKP